MYICIYIFTCGFLFWVASCLYRCDTNIVPVLHVFQFEFVNEHMRTFRTFYERYLLFHHICTLPTAFIPAYFPACFFLTSDTHIYIQTLTHIKKNTHTHTHTIE